MKKTKIPPWALVAGAVAIGALIWLIKQRREKLAQEAEKEGEPQPYIAGVENQAEEFPYSIGGALGGGGGAIGGAGESQSILSEFFKSQQSYLSESEKQQAEFEQRLSQQLHENQEAISRIGQSTISAGSGGGAPETAKSGTTVAPSTPPRCPAAYPNWNSKRGAVGPASCYRGVTCPNGCQGHDYQQSGAPTECQQKTGGKCHW